MAKQYDLKALFGDPDQLSLQDSALLIGDEFLTELTVSGLPLDFDGQSAMDNFTFAIYNRAPDFPVAVWGLGTDKEHKSILRIAFQNAVDADSTVATLIESIDQQLTDEAVPLLEQNYHIERGSEDMYEEAVREIQKTHPGFLPPGL